MMDADRIYVPLRERGVRALARETGTPIWAEAVDAAQPPHLEDGILLLPLPSSIRGLNPLTGAMLWEIPLARPLAAPLVSAHRSDAAQQALVLMLTDDGEISALRARDGQIVWRRSLGAPSRHAAAILPPSFAVITLSDGRVMALDARSGEPTWERRLPGTLSAPATGRDRVFVGSTNNFFYALDAKSGGEKWKWRTGGDVIGAAVEKDRVYFVSLDNILRAVNRDNGNQIWKTAIPTRPAAPPIAVGDAVVLTGVAPRIDAYDGKTGASLGSFTATSDLEGSPLVDRNPQPFKVALVTLTRDGRVTALRPTGLMFPDPPLVPLSRLPGREVAPDRPIERVPTPVSKPPQAGARLR